MKIEEKEKKNGFTLIEMLIVLFIITVVILK
ncbi:MULTISPECIES: prepilin-type N-terminal cleavage/methylation domain-containing protein [Kurthia]|nr:prepilin-type N-terminal cleavage/methylation domain-containing protein [Kurthia sp. 11kri321]HZG12725.1 prepilin-type N-terminal cleavage/methylation domain-containing protein [Kurthia gibsonii]